MRAIEDQIRAYATYADEVIGWADARDIIASPDAGRDSRVSPTRHSDDLTVDYLQLRPDQSTTLGEQKGWLGVAIAVAATILVVVGVAIVAGRSQSSTDIAGAPGDVEVLPFLDGLTDPSDVVFDPSGRLIVLEHLAGKVSTVEILADGSAGERVVTGFAMDDLGKLALDDNGALYVSNYDEVYRVPDNSVVTLATAPVFFATGTAGPEGEPQGLAVDANGDLYFAEDAEVGARITRVDVLDDGSAGTATEIVTVPGGGTYGDIEFGPTGELFVPNATDEIWAITFTDDGSMSSLRLLATIPGGPSALAFDASGTLYVGTRSGVVWSIEPGGDPLVVATGFDDVQGLAFDASGTLYLADAGANEVLRITAR